MGSQTDTNFRSLNAYASDIDQRLFSLQSQLPQMISRAISNANGVSGGSKYGQSTVDQQVIRRLQYLEDLVISLQEAQQKADQVPSRYDREILDDPPEQTYIYEQSPYTRKAKFQEQRDWVEPAPSASPKKIVRHYDKRQQFDASVSPSKASTVRLKSPPPPVHAVYDDAGDDDNDDNDSEGGNIGVEVDGSDQPIMQYNLSDFQLREQHGFPGSDPFTDLRDFTELLNQEEETPQHRDLYFSDGTTDTSPSDVKFSDRSQVARDQVEAATLLQAQARGFLARRQEGKSENILENPSGPLVDLSHPGTSENRTSSRSEGFDSELFNKANLTEEDIKFCEQTEFEAAQRIQKVYRGAKVRTLIGAIAYEGDADDEVVEVPSSEEEAAAELEAMHSGATALQKVFRGNKARKDLSSEQSNHEDVVSAGQLSPRVDIDDQDLPLPAQNHIGMMDIPFSDTALAEGLFAQEDTESALEKGESPRPSDVPDEASSPRSTSSHQQGSERDGDNIVDQES